MNGNLMKRIIKYLLMFKMEERIMIICFKCHTSMLIRILMRALKRIRINLELNLIHYSQRVSHAK